MADADASERAGAELARYYDLDLAEGPGDVDMYLALARSVQGPVLELAAGTGRLSVPLAAAGHDVIALDRDPDMLERARARWAATSHPAGSGSLDFIEADLLEYRPRSRFGLVVIALSSLLLIEREDQAAALATVAASLAPDGRAVIDVWLPGPEDLALYDGRVVLDWVRRDEEASEQVAKLTSARYAAAARSAEVTSFFDAWRDGAAESVRRTMRHDRIAFLTEMELQMLAQRAGLEVELMAGDYEMGEFGDDAERVVMVCRVARG